MKEDKGKGYAKIESRLLRYLVNNPIMALASHWIFQSLFYMDRTERWFKVGLDILITLLGGLIFTRWMPGASAWVSAFLVAHTLNFLLNGHLWGVLKHYGYVETRFEDFINYAEDLETRINRCRSIQWSAVYGSIARSQWTPSSDLDVRIVRRPGVFHGVIACTFVLIERSRALVMRFPLDVYLLDNNHSLERLRLDEVALELLEQSEGIMKAVSGR